MPSPALADAFAWADPALATLWTAWGVPVTRLEAVAFVLSVAMVLLNLRVNPWAWPLAIASSLMYGVLFARFRLYGEAGLQLVFVALAAWGWWQWLYGRVGGGGRHGGELPAAPAAPLSVRRLSGCGRALAFGVFLALWPVLGLVLDHATDSDVPWWDALPTAGSLVGQWLLGRKWVDNWPCWLLVNVASVALFACKGLWLTAILYAVFAGLSVWGWRAWALLVAPPPGAAVPAAAAMPAAGERA